MKDTKVVRDTFVFHERNNYTYGHYATDWETGLRHVRINSNLAVNEGNMIFLSHDLYRDPDGRRKMAHEYGIDVRSVADLPTLYAPRSDRKITKRSLLGTSYLFDERHNRVLCIDRREDVSGLCARASWATVISPAVSYTPLCTKERNFVAEKAWKEEHAGQLVAAKGVWALHDSGHVGNKETSVAVCKEWYRDSNAHAMDKFLTHLGRLQMLFADDFTEMVVDLTADYMEYPHLTTVPNGL